MFGLDQWLASFSDGASLVVVAAVAILLGLRHATDPDHLAAVTTLIAGAEERATRTAARLGAAWGAGHATSLFVFGVPIVLFRAYLPEPVQQGAETAVGFLIAGLAVWLLVRWRRGLFHVHVHVHAHGPEGLHAHGHVHPRGAHAHHGARARRPRQAYAIGLLHGTGGSAGVGVLLLALIHNHALALVALALFSVCTAISMALLSTGFGRALASPRLRFSMDRLAPAFGVVSLVFGAWYVLGALGAAPYFF
jgi:high-affinity nickel permease